MFGWSHPKNLSVACDRVNVLRLASPLGVGPIARPGPTTTDESPDQTDRRDLGTVGTASDRSGRGLETGVIADFRLHRKCAISIGVDSVSFGLMCVLPTGWQADMVAGEGPRSSATGGGFKLPSYAARCVAAGLSR